MATTRVEMAEGLCTVRVFRPREILDQGLGTRWERGSAKGQCRNVWDERDIAQGCVSTRRRVMFRGGLRNMDIALKPENKHSMSKVGSVRGSPRGVVGSVGSSMDRRLLERQGRLA